MACALVQDCAGERVLRSMLEDALCDAGCCGCEEELRLAERAFFHFATHHPSSV
jgi:hypothetical protein